MIFFQCQIDSKNNLIMPPHEFGHNSFEIKNLDIYSLLPEEKSQKDPDQLSLR